MRSFRKLFDPSSTHKERASAAAADLLAASDPDFTRRVAAARRAARLTYRARLKKQNAAPAARAARARYLASPKGRAAQAAAMARYRARRILGELA